MISNTYEYKRIYQEYKHITFLDDTYEKTTKFFKYIDIESLLTMLQSGRMVYVEPSHWYDPFEKLFYEADYTALGFDKPKVFCSCFTRKPTNEAAWIMYSHFRKGLASRSAKLELDPIVYYDFLETHGILTNSQIYIANVDYSLSEQTIKKLHLKTSKKHDKYFRDFSLEKFIKLLLIKRKAFEYEQEIRIFIIKDNKPDICPCGKIRELSDKIILEYDITLLSALIKSIVISPDCTPIEYKLIKNEIQRLTGNRIKCYQSGLYKPLTIDKIQIEA